MNSTIILKHDRTQGTLRLVFEEKIIKGGIKVLIRLYFTWQHYKRWYENEEHIVSDKSEFEDLKNRTLNVFFLLGWRLATEEEAKESNNDPR